MTCAHHSPSPATMIPTHVKNRFFVLLLPLLSAATSAAHAGVIYSGIQDVPIPLNFEGEYLRIDTGTTSGAYPANWDTAPWINPFFGGVYIGNSPLLRPIITGTDQILNLAAGTVIGSEGNFVAGESGSTTHVGSDPGQFALNVPGYIGVDFQTTTGGPDYYGWIKMTISTTGAAKINSWAYENASGTAIEAGAVPETGTACFGLLLLAVSLCRRNRRAQLHCH